MADDDTSSNKNAGAVLDPNDEPYVVESAQGSSSDDYEDPSDSEGLIAAAIEKIKKAGDARRKKAKKAGDARKKAGDACLLEPSLLLEHTCLA